MAWYASPIKGKNSLTKSNLCELGRTSENLVYEKQDRLAFDKDNPKVICICPWTSTETKIFHSLTVFNHSLFNYSPRKLGDCHWKVITFPDILLAKVLYYNMDK